MIVTGGENVYSGEVEAVLYEHPAVREAAVFGIPDPQWGELVMACVVLKPGKALSANDLIAYCRRSLPITRFHAGLSSQTPSYRRVAPAKYSRGFCVNVFGPIKNGP